MQNTAIGGYNISMTEPASLSPVSLTSIHLFAELCEELLGRGKRVQFRAPGRSMYPTIRENEVIIVEPTAPSEVKVGDIVLYRVKNGVVAHRVIRMETHDAQPPRSSSEMSDPTLLSPLSFILRGDALRIEDQPVEEGRILGKVVAVLRKGRPVSPYGRRADMRRLVHTIGSTLKRFF